MATLKSIVQKTFRYRLFVNSNQERELERTLETHRRLYNQVLEGRLLCWETAGVNWTFFQQSKWLTIQRKLNPHYANINYSSAEQTLRRLDKAYEKFFSSGCGSAGRPRFKSRDRFHSFTFRNGCKIVEGKLRLQYIGTIRVKWHRQLPSNAIIKQTTIKRYAGKWYVCFSVEIPRRAVSVIPSKRTGIDLGITSFATTSEGKTLGDAKILRRSLKELRRKQRALARCVHGSSRRKKVKRHVINLHAHVANARRDMHHKVAHQLVRENGVIATERLNVQGMVKNRRLARSISDAGWGQFITILKSKAENAGCRVIEVDPRNTSQMCSGCGEIVPKTLAQRVHSCACGIVLDRDHNAAINILKKAVRTEPQFVNVGNG